MVERGHCLRSRHTPNTPVQVAVEVTRLKLIFFTGILKVPPGNQQLYNKENQVMEDEKALQDYGLNSSLAKAQCPASVGLAIR